MNTVTAAFLPLLDASILIAAREIGFAKEHGIDLCLVRENSWANVRDRMAIGHFDVAHMLAPMPIASNLGVTPFDTEIFAPMALGLGGNAITASASLYNALGLKDRQLNAQAAGSALRAHLDGLEKDQPKLRFGVVHPHSAHNLELRYWLAASGINPDTDVDIVILPPALMADALRQQTIDGFCVGEPWNSLAAAREAGHVITTKNDIWGSSPEKVLGVRAEWARKNSSALNGLIRALYDAARWCDDTDNQTTLAHILARPDYLGLETTIIASALRGPAGFEPFARAATFPWQSHALWFYTQLVRWGLAPHTPAGLDRARRTYRPDIYRAALAGTDAIIPTSSAKVEGALTRAMNVGATGGNLILGPDGFFDGKIFDPDEADAYIAAQTRP